MENIIPINTNDQKKFMQKFTNKLFGNILKSKEIDNKTQIEQFDHDRREIMNIIAILLDQGLSINERLKRAGRAPANSSFTKEFKNNFIKLAKKNHKILEKSQKQKGNELKGILNLTLNNFTLNIFFKNVVSNSINLTLKNDKKLNKFNHIKQIKKENFKIKSNIKKNIIEDKINNSKLNIKNNINDIKKPQNKNFVKLDSFTKVKAPVMGFVPNVKISQVEALKKQRMEEKLNPKTSSIGRTMNLYKNSNN